MRVLQLIDSLHHGGAETIAVETANGLSNRGHQSWICSTREKGPLIERLSEGVVHWHLGRRSKFDLSALLRLRRLARGADIQLFHAHSTSIYLTTQLRWLLKGSLVWHDHYGGHGQTPRSSFPFKFLLPWIDAVIPVSHDLADWAVDTVGFEQERICWIPNFSKGNLVWSGASRDEASLRLICVANLRPQKDHANLIEAFALVKRELPEAHLTLVGDDRSEHADTVRNQIGDLGVTEDVEILGRLNDVGACLDQATVAVSSSVSEGLPLNLIEYGNAALPTVATDVGDSAAVLGAESGAFGPCLGGFLVPASDAAALAQAILDLSRKSSSERRTIGLAFRDWVVREFSEDRYFERLVGLYERVLSKSTYS